ncbi:MAG: ATP-binding protein [Erysipelotrichaceae bacterium]|jgi:MinD superfamily P-loop ATPase
MKQLLILSGKGGTGKTTIASAFIKLANAKAYSDCDVDAPNLHLVSGWADEPDRKDYYGLQKAEIDLNLCIGCDLCQKSCRFDAISLNGEYQINPFACEGCSVCEFVCPAKAITMVPAVAGELMLYSDREKAFSTAQLKMGSGNSGLLVTEVKKQMKSVAGNAEIAIIDGSPGIGCPVIASLSGVDMVLIVAEPTVSGISDMKRIIKTARGFKTRIAVCINKYDINIENSKHIQEICERQKLDFVGKIPFDFKVVEIINSGQTVVDADCISGKIIREVYQKVISLLLEKQEF